MTSRLRFWRNWSVRARMTAGLSVIVAGVVLAVFMYLPRRLERQATEALLDKGHSIAEMASYTLSAAVYFDDPTAIDEVLAGVREDGDVVYAGVADTTGRVLAWSGLRASRISQERIPLLEVEADILYQEQAIGRVEVGLSMTTLQQAIAASRRDAAAVCLLLLLAGVAAVYALAALLSNLERANRELEARFRTIFESSSIGLALIDAGGRIFEVNPALRKMVAGGTLQNRSLDELLEPAARSQVTGWLSDLIGARTSLIRTEVCGGRLFDRPTWLHLSLSAVRQPGGSLEFISVLVEDVTEQHQLVEQLQQSQKMEAIGRLAGGIAHDFNNLLTTINGTAELALSGMPPAELATDLLDILQAGKRAAELTTQLLAFSRRQIREVRVIDLNAVVAETSTLLRRMIGEDVRLHVALGKNVPNVLADGGQIGQVLMNLAVNARDAMKQGGDISIETVRARITGAEVAEMGLEESGEYAVVRVRDTGHGMDAATIARIFEPFFTTKEVGKGTGLGLAMVYGIVRQAGGGIKVTSQPGAGSTFAIALPVAPDAAVETPEIAEPVVETSAARGTVLLVEDEPAVRRLVARILKRAGFDVVEAANGLDGLAAAARMDVLDMVVSDVVMPGTLSGPEMALRLQEARPDLPVLFMSGYADAEILERVRTGTYTRLLNKPVPPGELVQNIEAMLLPATVTSFSASFDMQPVPA